MTMPQSLHSNLSSNTLVSSLKGIRAACILALGCMLFTAPSYADSKKGESSSQERDSHSSDKKNKGRNSFNYTSQSYVIPGSFPAEQGGYTVLTGINDRNDMVGEVGLEPLPNGFPPALGFINHCGVVEYIDLPGAVATSTLGINNRGAIVGLGVMDESISQIVGYVRNAHGQFSILPVEVEGDFSWVQPSTITDNGLIVGTCGSSTTPTRGFIIKDGEVSFYDHPGSVETYLWGGNDRGDVSGFWIDDTGDIHGFVITGKGKFVPIIPPEADGFRVLPRPINDKGEVIGTYRTTDGAYVFHFDVDTGGFTRINVPSGESFAVVGGINNRGVIVGIGESFTAGVIWTPQSKK